MSNPLTPQLQRRLREARRLQAQLDPATHARLQLAKVGLHLMGPYTLNEYEFEAVAVTLALAMIADDPIPDMIRQLKMFVCKHPRVAHARTKRVCRVCGATLPKRRST